MGFNQTELKDMLEQHKEWLKDNSKGKRLALDSSADLSSANLRYANLRYANLRYANLSSADLRYADLRYADLRYADLRYADLRYANLSSADLRYADLSSANLSSADLSSANLRYADLRYADLSDIKKDFFDKLLLAKNEAKGLFDFLQKGLVNGQTYEGECACFVGSVANIRKENHKSLTNGLKPEASSPIEKWFLAINKGDIPASNQVSKITCEWLVEFCKANEIVLPQYKIVSSDEAPEAFK